MRGRHRYTVAFAAVAVIFLVLLFLFATLVPEEGSDGTLWQLTVVIYIAVVLALIPLGLTIVRAARRLVQRRAEPPGSG